MTDQGTTENAATGGTCAAVCSAPFADMDSTLFTAEWWDTVCKTESPVQFYHNGSFFRKPWMEYGAIKYRICLSTSERLVTLTYDDRKTRDSDYRRFVSNGRSTTEHQGKG